MSFGRCHDCSASILFVRMRSGKAMPVAPVPDERGNVIALRARDGHLIDGYVEPNLAATLEPGCVRLMPHWAVCGHPKHLPARKPAPDPEPSLF